MLALLGGGGLAIAFDRATLRTRPADGADHLRELRAVHRVVGTALGVSLLTGTLLFFLHTERYVTSAIFWGKMALLVGLAGNALVMQIAERDIREEASPVRAWQRLRATARTSTTLWILIAVGGVVLGQAR